ncbi:hypothetical protein PCANC_05784 [Puccinia coronata f. sp. avenae]|uniref:Trafficking protein particle complex subunit 6B n=1 Tax=Puccinia coronata f. sp. avenae TaxID=200324 RepID=A0A2N5SUQ8_9BASI|nr:hypothetical protein PCANC_11365 [Puccinia coronata f. sp. avenae]PLW22597.1 hypothetical protein PCASD_12233 [Puccinia coronata f. sp. avenae]PLW45258.1 hypothetical protein PCASD_04030 [Puccinia coronata f. sp. avenae]PLW53112.1 hypothetical protein PCANC_05784 [Puccinia coronata f. sp. avenae]
MAPPATTINLYRPPSQVDAHLNDYFLNEMTQTMSESASHSLRTSSEAKRAYLERKRLQIGGTELTEDEPGRITVIQKNDLDEAHRLRMDAAGYKVGWSLAERLSRDKPRISKAIPDPLEIMKFICKDIWTAMYNKQVDNLRTNHRGIYVIQDHSYRAFLRVSVPKGYESEMDEMCRKMVIFPSAVIRGALMNLGVQSVVSVEIAIPQCTFQIRTTSTTPNPNTPPANPNPAKPN